MLRAVALRGYVELELSLDLQPVEVAQRDYRCIPCAALAMHLLALFVKAEPARTSPCNHGCMVEL